MGACFAAKTVVHASFVVVFEESGSSLMEITESTCDEGVDDGDDDNGDDGGDHGDGQGPCPATSTQPLHTVLVE